LGASPNDAAEPDRIAIVVLAWVDGDRRLGAELRRCAGASTTSPLPSNSSSSTSNPWGVAPALPDLGTGTFPRKPPATRPARSSPVGSRPQRRPGLLRCALEVHQAIGREGVEPRSGSGTCLTSWSSWPAWRPGRRRRQHPLRDHLAQRVHRPSRSAWAR